jgi:hypothetical protein
VVAVVLTAQVVHVRRGDQRPVDLPGDPGDSLVGLLLGGYVIRLNLEVDVLRSEQLQQVVRVRPGVGGPVLDDPLTEARLEAPGERDHPFRVLLEKLRVDVRAPAREPHEEARRAELHQVLEPGLVRRQQGDVVALVAHLALGGLAVLHQVGLHAEDRLQPSLPARAVHLHGAVHHAVVGEADRGHAQLRRPGRHLVDLARSVQQRILAVDVQVDGLRFPQSTPSGRSALR